MADDTVSTLADLIASLTDVERDRLQPEANLIDDLELDSVDVLDIAFEVEDKFGIELDVESWREKIESGEVETAEYFVLAKLAGHIDALVSAKPAKATPEPADS